MKLLNDINDIKKQLKNSNDESKNIIIKYDQEIGEFQRKIKQQEKEGTIKIGKKYQENILRIEQNILKLEEYQEGLEEESKQYSTFSTITLNRVISYLAKLMQINISLDDILNNYLEQITYYDKFGNKRLTFNNYYLDNFLESIIDFQYNQKRILNELEIMNLASVYSQIYYPIKQNNLILKLSK